MGMTYNPLSHVESRFSDQKCNASTIDFSVQIQPQKHRPTMTRSKNDYKPILVALLSYLDNEKYPKDAEFTSERLLQLTPTHISQWMNVRTFGVPNPGLDANPISARSSSLMYWKKAISSFMPHRLEPWRAARNEGNPTRSQEINELIARVKKKEVRRQGVPSQARRSLTESEYRQQQTILRESAESGNLTRYGIPALSNFQVHMIGRIDCVCQFRKEHFQPHDVFPDFAAKAKFSWSKNVQQEGDAPWQIVLGSRDPVFCVFISTAIWLEYYLSCGSQGLSPYVFDFSGDFTVPDGGDKSNAWVMNALKGVYTGADFIPEKDGPLGSHSVRKFASTWCRRSGASKEEKDYRGRWKKDRHVSDVYDDEELPYPDAKVAALLCVGGPCSYRIKESSPVTDDWILQHVVPRIAAMYGPTLAKVLGKALLWVIFSEKSGWVSGLIVERVKGAYNNLLGEASDENPIEKRLLVVTGDDATLYINEVVAEQGQQQQQQQQQQQEVGQQQQEEQPVVSHLEGRTNRQLLQTLLSQVNQLQTSVLQMSEAREADKVMLSAQFRVINTNLRRVASQPVRALNHPQQNNNGPNNGGGMGAGSNGGIANPLLIADLIPTPRTLYILWQEYQEGIGGRKAARLFTRDERGKVKHKYHRRKVVWDLISQLIRSGLTAQVACDRIYNVYGEGATVTSIINRLKVDIRNGTLHSILQV